MQTTKQLGKKMVLKEIASGFGTAGSLWAS